MIFIIVPHQERLTLLDFNGFLAASAAKMKQTHRQNENCTHDRLETESEKNGYFWVVSPKQEGV